MRSPVARGAVIAGAVVVLALLFVLLRRSGDDNGSAGPTEPTAATARTTPTGTTTTTTSATTTTTTTTTAPAVQVVRVVVRDGRPVGGLRTVDLEQGERVRLVVRADVSDEVHLHGYDLSADVAPGSPAQIAFRATIAGRFEVELESRGLQILELEVRP